RRPMLARPLARRNSRCSWLGALDRWEIPTDVRALVLMNGKPRERSRRMLRRRIRQIVRPLLESLAHRFHVPVPIVNCGHTAVGMPEYPLNELVARVPQAFCEARRDRPTQIVRAELLGEFLSRDRENRIGKTSPEILRHPLYRRAPIRAREKVIALLRFRDALEDLHRLRNERHDVNMIALLCAGRDHHERLLRVDPADPSRSPFIAAAGCEK